MKKRVVEVVSTFVLRKLARRDSSHYDQIAMEFQPLLDQSAGSQSGHEQFIADKLPERPAYVRGAIVEMRASVYDESPIDFCWRSLR
jgi:hypothetical protein